MRIAGFDNLPLIIEDPTYEFFHNDDCDETVVIFFTTNHMTNNKRDRSIVDFDLRLSITRAYEEAVSRRRVVINPDKLSDFWETSHR
jgi:hypothetical protein